MKHVVGFSGGIDSQACARWVLNRYPAEDVILLNSDAGGNEHPLTTEFVKQYSENVHPVVTVQAIMSDLGKSRVGSQVHTNRQEYDDSDVLTFDRLAQIKGRFPSRTSQFCTEYLKLRPQNRWIRENVLERGETCIRYTGVRRQESKARVNRKPVEWDDWLACEMQHPIVDFTKQMCFDYVKYHGEEFNPLYTMGFDRVGCSPCINSTKDDILAWEQRSPESIAKVRRWEKATGKTFFSPMVPGLEINWIDDVVRWAKTTRGGKQFSLLVLQERPACESEYGLCE